MRAGRGILRMVIGRGERNYRGFFWIFKKKGAEIERLKAQLTQGGISPNPEDTARIHTALANQYLKENKAVDAVEHAKSAYAQLKAINATDLKLMQESARALTESLSFTNQLQEATEPAETCERLARHIFPVNSPNLARSLFSVSYVKGRTGREEEAAGMCKEVIQLARTVKDRALEGDAQSALAHYHLRAGKSAEAMEAFTTAIECFRAEKMHEALSPALLSLADLFVASGDHATGQQLCEEALGVLKHFGGGQEAVHSKCLERLIMMSLMNREFDTASQYLRHKMSFDEELHPKESDVHIQNARMQGLILVETGKYSAAKSVLEKALQSPSPGKEERIRVLNLLCTAYSALKDNAGLKECAERMMTEALAIPNFSEMSKVYLDYATYQQSLGNHQSAFTALSQCISLSVSQQSPYSVYAYIYLAEYYHSQKELDLSVQHMRKACELYAKLGREETVEMARFLNDLGIREGNAKMWEAAELSMNKSLEISLRLGEEGKELALSTRKYLGKMLIQVGKTAEAQEVLTAALQSAEGQDHTEISSLLHSLQKSP